MIAPISVAEAVVPVVTEAVVPVVEVAMTLTSRH
jgi:hypothetical protein